MLIGGGQMVRFCGDEGVYQWSGWAGIDKDIVELFDDRQRAASYVELFNSVHP